jgi:hypothetical protein
VRSALVLLVAALAACAPRVGGGDRPRADTITVGDATIRVEYFPIDADAAKQVIAALEQAVPRAERWGELRTPVSITLHPDHEALEAAVHREGFDWLRAWARYASVDLQSPRTWTSTWSPFKVDQQEVEELVAHELTHCVMYQNAASDWSWPYKSIPLWFREGMASVTAQQGYRWKGVEDLSRFYAEAPRGARGRDGARPGDGAGAGAAAARAEPRRGGDPVSEPEPLYQSEPHVVYGAAHLAFEFLVARYGDEGVRAVLARMGEGHLFGEAFRHALGIEVAQFEAEFRRYVVWRGWQPAAR